MKANLRQCFIEDFYFSRLVDKLCVKPGMQLGCSRSLRFGNACIGFRVPVWGFTIGSKQPKMTGQKQFESMHLKSLVA